MEPYLAIPLFLVIFLGWMKVQKLKRPVSLNVYACVCVLLQKVRIL